MSDAAAHLARTQLVATCRHPSPRQVTLQRDRYLASLKAGADGKKKGAQLLQAARGKGTVKRLE